jgi:hypothetical protein
MLSADKSDQLRINLAGSLHELLWEQAFGLKRRLDDLEGTLVPNVGAIMRDLCDQADDPALARLDAARCVAVMTRQLGALYHDLIRPKREASTPAKPVKTRLASK